MNRKKAIKGHLADFKDWLKGLPDDELERVKITAKRVRPRFAAVVAKAAGETAA